MNRTGNGSKESNTRRATKAKKRAQWNRVVELAATIDDEGIPEGPRNALALKRLGVSVEQVRACPRITPMLRLADGSLPQVFSAMRSSADPLIRAFLAKYDTLSASDRELVSIEAVALAANLDVTSLLGAIMITLERNAAAIIRIMTVTAHPKIVAARIRFGQLPSGERDRSALDQCLGLLPNPKGPIFVNRIYNAGKGGVDQRRNGPDLPDDEDEPLDGEVPIAAMDDIDLDKLFPPANETQEELIPIRARLHAGNQQDTDPAPRPTKDQIDRLLFRKLPKQGIPN